MTAPGPARPLTQRCGTGRRTPARRGRDERGFALVAVLAVVALTGITIAALLGLMVTTMRVTSAQERNARESRAADGAIEVAVEKMRTEPCDPTRPFLSGEVFDQGTPGVGDDVSVDIECRSDSDTNVSGTDQVRLLGTRPYDGSFQWRTDCAVHAAEGCFPWGAALGSIPSGLDDIALVHTGHDPLRFSTGVSVRSGGIGLRSAPAQSPALDVGGPYTQGAPGVGATSAQPCGLLEASGGPAAVRASNNTPLCDSEDARDVVIPAPQVPAPAATVTADQVPVCNGPVIVFPPGRYGAAATAAVSALTSGASGCTGRTFHFAPGIHSFDGDLIFGDSASYYVFGAPAGWGLGGVQASPSAAVVDAELCDTGASGTTVVISARSQLRHDDGRVAICPAYPHQDISSDPFPAISQELAVPSEVHLATPGSQTLEYRWVLGEDPVGAYTKSSYYPLNRNEPARITASGSTPLSSVALYLSGTEGVDVQNNLVERRRATVILRAGNTEVCRSARHDGSDAYQDGLPNSGHSVRYDLMTGSCATYLAGRTVADLDGLGVQVRTEQRLESPFISNRLTIDGMVLSVNETPTTSTAASVDGKSDWTDPQNVVAADGSFAHPVMPCPHYACRVHGNGWTKDDLFRHELVLGSFTSPALQEAALTGATPQITQLRAELSVSIDEFPSPAWFDEIPLLGGRKPENLRPRMTTTMTMRTAAGEDCSVRVGFDPNIGDRRSTGGVNSRQIMSFDMLDPNASGSGCSAVRLAVAEQEPVQSAVVFEMPCVYIEPYDADCLRFPWGSSDVIQVRPPSIDHFTVRVATDTYTGPVANSSVRIDAVDAPTSSAFNVYGKAWLPRTDLDIRWHGAVTAAPLFADDLVLNGLGSVMAPDARMGIVCCSPPDSRTVELTAFIDGVERMVSRVEFVDVDDDGNHAPGYRVNVLRWLDCRGACASVLAATETVDPLASPEVSDPSGPSGPTDGTADAGP